MKWRCEILYRPFHASGGAVGRLTRDAFYDYNAPALAMGTPWCVKLAHHDFLF